MMMKPLHAIGAGLLLAGAVVVGVAAHADDPAARGVDYFAHHLMEDDQLVSQCKTGVKLGTECGNAKRAIDAAKARQQENPVHH